MPPLEAPIPSFLPGYAVKFAGVNVFEETLVVDTKAPFLYNSKLLSLI